MLTMRGTRTFVLLGFIVAAASASASWVKRYDAAGLGDLDAISPHPDGGAVVFGSSVLFVIDARGNVRTARAIGHSSHPSFAATGLKGEITFGFEEGGRNPGEESEIHITRLDRNLQQQWSRSYAVDDRFVVRSTAVTNDGGLILAGKKSSAAALIRLNADGIIRWTRVLNVSGGETFLSVHPLRDGGYLLGGYTTVGGWLVRLNAEAGMVWQKTFTRIGHFDAVTETTGGDLLAIGPGVSARGAQAGTVLMRMDRDGITRWQNRIEATGSDGAAVVPLAGNDVLAVLDPLAEGGLVLVRINAAGNAVWSRLYRSAPLMSSGPQREDVAVSGDQIFLAPQLTDTENPFTTRLVFALDSKSGTAPCASFENWEVKMTPFQSPVESLTIAFGSVALRGLQTSLDLSPIDVTSTDYVCRTVPRQGVIPGNLPATSSFLGRAEAMARQRQYGDLFLKRDWPQLEKIADTLRTERTFTDPMRSNLVEFYEGVSEVELDDATRIAMHRAWLEAYPQSITARLSLAGALNIAAMRRIGGGRGVPTEAGREEYDRLMEESRKLVAEAGSAADSDPLAWVMRIKIARQLAGGDVREMARRASEKHVDPQIFLTAASYLHPGWGSSAREFRVFAEQVAEWTKAQFGDGMYAWLAYQALFLRGEVKYADYAFDWRRVQQGMRDIIRLKPAWLPSWHRFALMAHRMEDRPLARDLFARPELVWYEGAEKMWGTREAYEAVRQWATSRPTEVFMEPRPGQTTAPAPPPAPPAPVPSTKLKAPATAAATFQENPFIAGSTDQWPQIVMQNELVIAGTTHRDVTSFLLETAEGIVAISAVAARGDLADRDKPIEEFKRRLSSWRMWSPTQPDKVLQVAAFEPNRQVSYQFGVALTLAPFAGDLPVHPLKPLPADRPKKLTERVFVVGCRWKGTVCEQTVIPGTTLGGTGIIKHVGLSEVYDPAALRGAAILNEDGFVIAVARGTSLSWSAQYATTIDSDEIQAVIGQTR